MFRLKNLNKLELEFSFSLFHNLIGPMFGLGSSSEEAPVNTGTML